MTTDSSRQSASLAASLALHAAMAALLIGRSVVELKLEPSPLVLSLVEASTQTAGPGALAPELREAAPSPAPAAAAVAPPVPEAAPPEEVVEPVVVPKPRPVPVPAKKPPAARPATPPPAQVATAVASAPSAGGNGQASSVAGEGGHGDAARATAPAWAPTARVRYEELLYAWMNRHKDYPLLAQRRGLQGRGSVRVRIDRDGRVIDRSVVTSTGQGVLDEAALEMVRRASPFPAVPEGYAGSSFEFVAPVEYRLR